MSSLALELFVGPAVVVDDEVTRENTGAHELVKELEEANFPVLKKRQLPADDEIRHWQAMSLIVLDWDLYGGSDFSEVNVDSETSIEGGIATLGVSLPEHIAVDPRRNCLRFIKKLMDELYCPIFVVSNHDVHGIWQQLEEDRTEDEIRQLHARVMVKSKTQSSDTLLEGLNSWISRHPAVYALKLWERSYENAKSSLFADFQGSDIEWPGILWRTAYKDGVNPNHDLTETISRNLFHRMDPNVFSSDIISSDDKLASMDSVRRVLHQHAVLPAERLHSDVIMPGDFFFDSDTRGNIPEEIDICLTPACDLVSRNGKTEEIRMFMVRAFRVPESEFRTRKSIDRQLQAEQSTTSVLLHHLVPENAMYIVRFKNWSVTKWGAVRETRRGRLLEPYVSLLQQRSALFSQRQGLPRLPDGFYQPG